MPPLWLPPVALFSDVTRSEKIFEISACKGSYLLYYHLTMKHEIITGNYKATIKQVIDGYGDTVFRATVVYLDKGAQGIDAASERVRFAKSYDKESKALQAAKKELQKCAA